MIKRHRLIFNIVLLSIITCIAVFLRWSADRVAKSAVAPIPEVKYMVSGSTSTWTELSTWCSSHFECINSKLIYKKDFFSFCQELRNPLKQQCTCGDSNIVVDRPIDFTARTNSYQNRSNPSLTLFSSITFNRLVNFHNISEITAVETIGWETCRVDCDTVVANDIRLKQLDFTNCYFDSLSLFHDTLNQLLIDKSEISSLVINNCYDSFYNSVQQVYDAADIATYEVPNFLGPDHFQLHSASFDNLTLTNNKISIFEILRSKVSNIEIDSSNNSQSWMVFENDTITSMKVRNSPSLSITFKNCVIMGPLSIHTGDTSSLFFNNCNFEGDAVLDSLECGNLYFNNCKNFDTRLEVIAASKSNINLFFDLNTDLSKIIFDYDKNFKICYNRYNDNDENGKLFDNIIAKFKGEYKSKSVKKVQVEYKEYRYSMRIWLYPIWILDWAWWYYGFEKGLIVIWTLLFLIIFYCYNYYHWSAMIDEYNVLPHLTDLSLDKQLKSKSSYVLLFTLFIFFSIRIDFDRLQYKESRYLKAFFIQYIIGIVCLFFLINAIFKID